LKSAAHQYADALADVVLQGDAQTVVGQLADLADAYHQSVELRNAISSPAVSKEAKRHVMEQLAARVGAGPVVRNFLFVVVDHQRASLLPEISDAFQTAIRRRQGIVEAEIISAFELTDAQKSTLVQSLERRTGKKIEAKYSLQPGLLGGVSARVGDTVFDGSVRAQLGRLREQLAAE
jgi:F-type H+-transporting ATPase subunit delta